MPHKPGDRFHHPKTDAIYVVVIGEVIHSETNERMVAYRREGMNTVFVRPAAMFDDGRFVRIENEGAPR